MIIDHSSSNPVELKTRLWQIVLESKISSIEKLSDITGAEEEEARLALEELVSEGSLTGSFTEDGSRFFLSDVKTSDAPIIRPVDLAPETEVKDSKISKTVFISGIINPPTEETAAVACDATGRWVLVASRTMPMLSLP